MRTCKTCDREFCSAFVLRRHMSQFHPMEKQPYFQPRRRRVVDQTSNIPEQKTFHLGKNTFVKPTLDGVQLVQYLPGLPNVSRTVVSLGAREYKQLLAFSNVLKSALKKRPESAKTLAEYEMLFRHQTKFLLGKTVYVIVSHNETVSELQFREYMMVSSLSVTGTSVVCPGRFLIGLNRKQFDELLSRKQSLKLLLKEQTTQGQLTTKRKVEHEEGSVAKEETGVPRPTSALPLKKRPRFLQTQTSYVPSCVPPTPSTEETKLPMACNTDMNN